MNPIKIITLVSCLVLSLLGYGQKKTENVILITFDGLRWQELFSGADPLLVGNKNFVNDSAKLTSKYWRQTPEERRAVLMPFFWDVIASQGQLYGNRKYGNKVNVTNQMWFSYPGYNEILTGAADDKRITSNDKIDNPNTTILEVVNRDNRFAGKVATFSSWDCFPYIINTKRSGVPVNAGMEKQENTPNENEKLLNELMFDVANPLGETRLDGFTFRYAEEYLKKNKPRLLYIALNDTDDFAHGGKYDLYLEAAHYIDNMIGRLWQWIQSNPQYNDKTTLIITTDHGRGQHDENAWRHHGIKVPEADQIWMAVMGPDASALGELKNDGQLYQNQVAKTIAELLGVKFEIGKSGDAIAAATRGK